MDGRGTTKQTREDLGFIQPAPFTLIMSSKKTPARPEQTQTITAAANPIKEFDEVAALTWEA